MKSMMRGDGAMLGNTAVWHKPQMPHDRMSAKMVFLERQKGYRAGWHRFSIPYAKK